MYFLLVLSLLVQKITNKNYNKDILIVIVVGEVRKKGSSVEESALLWLKGAQ